MFDDIKYNRKLLRKIRLVIPLLIPNLYVFYKKVPLKNMNFVYIIKILCLYASYLIMIPILKYLFFFFNPEQKFYISGVCIFIYYVSFNYNYLLNKIELEHNLFNINTSMVFIFFFYMILITQLSIQNAFLLISVFNLVFVYQNYTRKYLSNNKPGFYYIFYLFYFLLGFFQLYHFSKFGFIFMLYIFVLFLVAFTILSLLLEKFRAKIRGPFSLPPLEDYSFETYHVLVKKINVLTKKYI